MPGKRKQSAPRLFLRGEIWWADIRKPDGRRLRISTGHTDEAQARRWAEQRALDERAPTTAGGLKLWQALEETWEQHWKASKSAPVVRRVIDAVARDMGTLPVSEVNYPRLNAYAQFLIREGKAHATINRRMSLISKALGDLVKSGDLPAKPSMPRLREAPPRDRYLSPDEEQRIEEALDRRIAAERVMRPYEHSDAYEYLRAVFHFLLDTGLRFGELFEFRVIDNHADLRNGTTKNGKGRRVPLTKRAAAAAEYIKHSPTHLALLRMGRSKGWYFVDHRWHVICKDADVSDLGLHGLRHTAASRLVQRGVPIYVVSKILGHSSVKITERYAKLDSASLIEAISVLERDGENTAS